MTYMNGHEKRPCDRLVQGTLKFKEVFDDRGLYDFGEVVFATKIDGMVDGDPVNPRVLWF